MMLFINKQKQLEQQMDAYREKITQCLESLYRTLEQYCRHNDRGQLRQNLREVHQLESKADDIRREIEIRMYSKALFPESRGDILGLLEALDKIPNRAEAAVWMLWTHHITIPESFCPGILQLIDLCQRCVAALLDGIETLFTDFTSAGIAVGKVDELESETDHSEAILTEQVFASDLDGAHKLLLRDLIERIASLSDSAENVGDRLRIIVAKRKV